MSLVEYLKETNLSKLTKQIVLVIAEGSSCVVCLCEKQNNLWIETLKCNGFVGDNGVGVAKEGSRTTPKGAYPLSFAFGFQNPGAKLPFRYITDNSYWISNVEDPSYNTWQERKFSSKYDEKLSLYTTQYKYAIVIDYNKGIGEGSAFFLHCSNGKPTAGCVSVSEENMVKLVRRISLGAYILNVVDKSEILKY